MGGGTIAGPLETTLVCRVMQAIKQRIAGRSLGPGAKTAVDQRLRRYDGCLEIDRCRGL